MLHMFGWSESLEHEFQALRAEGLEPARVAREERGRYRLLTSLGERPGEVSGRLRNRALSRSDFPAVGDWIAVRTVADDGPCVIEAVLPRRGVFTRKAAGNATEEQIVAANVDTVFLVSGLDADLNPRRIERYLTAAWESGAAPVVVLNKADVASDPGASIREVERVALGIPVVAVSARSRVRLEALRPWLGAGRTVALLGSSGVGKSTLVNALLGEERQDTGTVRADDSRGRHTTTHRELIPLPGGAVLLDTPGMRELQLWGDESTLAESFPDVEALAGQCRFRDCRHDAEPGCAVRAADADGALAAGRLESWRKLQRELAWLATKQDVRLRMEEEGRWRAVARSQRRQKKSRGR